MRLGLRYVLAGVGLVGGLAVVLAEPLPSTSLNLVVGGALLVLAIAAVTAMIVESSASGDRGPDF